MIFKHSTDQWTGWTQDTRHRWHKHMHTNYKHTAIPSIPTWWREAERHLHRVPSSATWVRGEENTSCRGRDWTGENTTDSLSVIGGMETRGPTYNMSLLCQRRWNRPCRYWVDQTRMVCDSTQWWTGWCSVVSSDKEWQWEVWQFAVPTKQIVF